MGIKIGGGGFPGQSDLISADTSGPSGKLHIYEPKDFPYLNTGKSLVFVIARNGMVWGKRLDEQSSKGDIELEVFWPIEDGCLVKQWSIDGYGIMGPTGQVKLHEGKKIFNFSKEQDRKIESILSQKETIQYELGTLMVRPETDTTNHDYKQALPYRRMDKPIPLLLDFSNEPCNIKVVDCSFINAPDRWCFSNKLPFPVRYNDALAKFEFFSEEIHISERFQLGTMENPKNLSEINRIHSHWKEQDGRMVATNIFAATLSAKCFDISKFDIDSGLPKMKQNLRIMYGEYDFFEYFEVDDATLILVYQNINGALMSFSWALAIAQNKLVREMMRLASNNLDLFAPLITK